MCDNQYHNDFTLAELELIQNNIHWNDCAEVNQKLFQLNNKLKEMIANYCDQHESTQQHFIMGLEMTNLNDIERSLNIVQALEITETSYRGQIIKMCETEHDIYTVNIINSSGKLIHAMADIPHWEEADMWAIGFIDGYLLRNGEV